MKNKQTNKKETTTHSPHSQPSASFVCVKYRWQIETSEQKEQVVFLFISPAFEESSPQKTYSPSV